MNSCELQPIDKRHVQALSQNFDHTAAFGRWSIQRGQGDKTILDLKEKSQKTNQFNNVDELVRQLEIGGESASFFHPE